MAIDVAPVCKIPRTAVRVTQTRALWDCECYDEHHHALPGKATFLTICVAKQLNAFAILDPFLEYSVLTRRPYPKQREKVLLNQKKQSGQQISR